METSLEVLLFSAASIGFVHTLIGIDHSLPFVVLGRARGWSLRKVWSITFLCGFGHVLSSVLFFLSLDSLYNDKNPSNSIAFPLASNVQLLALIETTVLRILEDFICEATARFHIKS